MASLPRSAGGSTPHRPTSASERIHALDAMRGVAILGVLIAETVWSLGSPPREAWSTADHIVARGMELFVDGKFLSLFACLFGVGVAMQWRRWEAGGSDLVGLHLRRMAFLLAVGLVHGVLLRNGDILAPYAILGLLLLPLRRIPTLGLVVLALFLVWVPYLSNTVVQAAGLNWPDRPVDVTGGYLVENLAWLRYWYVTNPLRSWPVIMALMLAGLLLFRSGLVERLATDRRLAARTLATALTLAIASRVAFDGLSEAWGGQEPSEARLLALGWLYQVATWTLAATYASLFLVLCQLTWTSLRLGVLKSVGRMAFTNYLTQALVVVPICLVFGLFDQMPPSRGLLLGLAVGAAQVGFSIWWMRRHAMGPFERLWRRATYGPGAGT